MPRVRRRTTKNQASRADAAPQSVLPLDDGSVTTPAALAMIQAALIPLGLKAVEEALLAEVTALAGPRYHRDDAHPDSSAGARKAGQFPSPIRSSRSRCRAYAIAPPRVINWWSRSA